MEIKKHKQKMKEFSKDLNRRQIPAEMWFRSKWDKAGMILPIKKWRKSRDRFNYPIGLIIPDLINFKFKYAIEVDEDHHQLIHQKIKDKRKDEYLINRGFSIIRVPAYNEESMNSCINKVMQIRLNLLKTNPNSFTIKQRDSIIKTCFNHY